MDLEKSQAAISHHRKRAQVSLLRKQSCGHNHASFGETFIYGGPLSRSNYRTYRIPSKREQSANQYSRNNRSILNVMSSRNKSKSPRHVGFNSTDRTYQEMNRIETSHNQNFTRRQLVTGMKPAKSTRDFLSLDRLHNPNQPLDQTLTQQETKTSQIDVFKQTLFGSTEA